MVITKDPKGPSVSVNSIMHRLKRNRQEKKGGGGGGWGGGLGDRERGSIEKSTTNLDLALDRQIRRKT